MDHAEHALRCAFKGRASRQRLVIAAAADVMTGTFAAEDLLTAVRASAPRTGLATIYRTLSAMAETGFVEQVGTRSGAAIYARCRSHGHHHHIVCTSCGHVAEAACDVSAAIERASRDSGFTVTGHEFNLFGLCADCVDRKGKAS